MTRTLIYRDESRLFCIVVGDVMYVRKRAFNFRTLSPSMHIFKSSSCCGAGGSPAPLSAMYSTFGLQDRPSCVEWRGFGAQPADIPICMRAYLEVLTTGDLPEHP